MYGAIEFYRYAKEEGLNYLDGRRKNIQAMSREDAVSTLAHVLKIDSKSETIASVSDNRLLDVV
jgi:DNA polymerase III alpha subunit